MFLTKGKNRKFSEVVINYYKNGVVQLPETRAYVVELINIIRRYVPEVREQIAWSMPLFEKDRHTISLATC